MVVYWAGNAGGFGRTWVGFGSNAAYLSSLGFAVRETISSAKYTPDYELQSQISGGTYAKVVHGLYYWGHGYIPDPQTKRSPGLARAGGQPMLDYQATGLGNLQLNYKLAIALIYACFSNDGQSALSSGRPGSIFHGYTGTLYPFPPFRADFQARTYIKRGDQGTRNGN